MQLFIDSQIFTISTSNIKNCRVIRQLIQKLFDFRPGFISSVRKMRCDTIINIIHMLSLHLCGDNLFLFSSTILLLSFIKIRLLGHQFVIGLWVHNVVLIIINFLYNLQKYLQFIFSQYLFSASMQKHRIINTNSIFQKLQQQKKSMIQSFLKDYIYGSDGDFLNGITERQYNSKQTYQGEVDDQMRRSGTGIYESPQGFIYLGEWFQDQFHGEGIYISSNNQRYQGQMNMGVRQGRGTFYHLDGRVYKGQWLNNEKDGFGIEQGDNVFEGQWSQGFKSGSGKLIFQDGGKYQGQFLNDLPHGKGFYQNSMMKYEGQFQQGSFNGEGKVTYKSGFMIQGTFEKNEIKYGSITYPNGDFYKGTIEGIQKSGSGQYNYNSGQVYEGMFKKGLKNGLGKMYFINGDIYEGMWQNGLKHGKGKYVWSNGDTYEGGFWLDKRQGEAIIHYPSGGRYQGYWKNDKKEGEGVLFQNQRATKIFNN